MIWRHIVTACRWRPVARLVAAALLALPAIGAGGVPASAVTPGAGLSTYYHVTSSSDTGWFLTNLHNTGGSGALVFVMPNWGQIPIQTNYHPVGVVFNSGTGSWSIYNEDGAAMPTNVVFNVLEFQPPLPSVFVHTATTSNSTGNWTDMDNPALNNNPNAVVVVTPNFNPGGVSGASDRSPVGVWYNTSTLAGPSSMKMARRFPMALPSTSISPAGHTRPAPEDRVTTGRSTRRRRTTPAAT